MTKIINHQLQNSDFYFPNWEVNFLFLGTFNPEGGEDVSYYYGRKRNQTWKLISKIFQDNIDPADEDFLIKLIKHKIACVDLIYSIEKNDSSKFNNDELAKIKGKGYSDTVIISRNIKRNYNTSKINDLISKNQSIRVFSTWGKGKQLKSWKAELEKVNIDENLCSPSLAAKVPKGEKKFEFMLADWQSKINLNF